MKPTLLLLFICILFLSACKKENPSGPTAIKSNIIGTWHQVSETRSFYVNRVQDVWDQAVEQYNWVEPYDYKFNADNTINPFAPNSSPDISEPYTITSTNGADSLICNNIRAKIASCTKDQLVLNFTDDDVVMLVDGAGILVQSDQSIYTFTFKH